MSLLDAAATDARPSHLSRFYGPVGGQTPLLLVHGNCQAESLRIALGGADDHDSVRLPPVHEIRRADLPRLHAWLRRADLLVSQPVRDGFAGVPVGTREVRAHLPVRARTVLVPVVRFAGLYPTHAIIRPPSDAGLVPPLVAYHDLRTLAQAAARRFGRAAPRAGLTRPAIREIARLSLDELQTREQRHGTVPVSDVLRAPSFAHMRTVNHPGNPVWEVLADRVRAALGLPSAPTALRRPLLDAVHAPRLPEVIDAFGLQDEPEADWRLDGRRLAAHDVRDAHLRFYERHPDAVDAGLARHAETLRLLGLT